jgi:AcrR family transcriptional regulator
MPKIVDSNQYRKKLLADSFDLFIKRGYGSLTMRTLAQELGVSPATLYNYFESKEDLFLRLVEEQEIQDVLDFPASASECVTLESSLLTLFHFVHENEEHFCKQILLWIEFYQQQSSSQHPSKKVFGDLGDPTLQGITECLQLSDRALAGFILNFLNGWLLGRVLFGSDDDDFSFSRQAPIFIEAIRLYLERRQVTGLFSDSENEALSAQVVS